MKLRSIFILPLVFLGLMGCQLSPEKTTQHIVNVPLSVPLAANFRNEIAIARYSELLSASDLPKEQKAQLYYNRGMLYDSLGLSTLARIDFNRALKMKPDLAEVYNFLGIHHTLSQEYGQAYEMFDAVLELDEAHEYAYLNRGIALYYGERPNLASQDLAAFLARSPQDAYRVMWLYLAQTQLDHEQALEQLRLNSNGLDQELWANQLVQLYLGELTEGQFLAQLGEGVSSQQEYAERLCEAYFYLAKRYQARGDKQVAIDFFKLVLATNVYEFVEHKYARLELDLLANDEDS
ncbi:Lipoprotein NlpI [Pseudoalteromonas holothuriae]|uniref:Lipoprotein NlpI n=1 Tax=Pseudoalteromonas holothuriae TaxID=2963714 RepID=A0A9W4QZ85_9GAMM|nr:MULTISPECIES: lipoprotein NlpI [unclassified Pseudoalteromonas]CAH9059782.1 Lipoprotein NlpI [Pseudoalteromonas sp. CIP111854]CAH9064084.1 Lipoprotein NlpI [Pseudoalteromonas sp. CIP111951]